MNPIFKKLPVIVESDDYHEFDFLQDTLNNFFASNWYKINFEELGYCCGKYLAIYYAGKKPIQKEIAKLLSKTDFFDDEKKALQFVKTGEIEDN